MAEYVTTVQYRFIASSSIPLTLEEARAHIQGLMDKGELKVKDFDLAGSSPIDKAISQAKILVQSGRVNVQDLVKTE